MEILCLLFHRSNLLSPCCQLADAVLDDHEVAIDGSLQLLHLLLLFVEGLLQLVLITIKQLVLELQLLVLDIVSHSERPLVLSSHEHLTHRCSLRGLEVIDRMLQVFDVFFLASFKVAHNLMLRRQIALKALFLGRRLID